jgi:glycosyltransferase involved in cell wall biosynthesis
MSTVFVGIPTYNRPTMVQDAILSVCAQRFDDFRVIVSDNCSARRAADETERFVAELADDRIGFYRQPENGGEYGQGRFLFEQARGHQLFVILHDDDVMLPDFLAAGVAALAADPAAAFFVANAYAMDREGRRSGALTRFHLRGHGRFGARDGSFDVLTKHMLHGFAPISGTLFRRAALEQSGFVDADLGGNFPFESNIFLRLGEAGAQACFSSRELLGVRYHGGTLSGPHLLWDPAVIGTCIRLWERRSFTGRLERRRRKLLSRYRRAEALIQLRNGNIREAQSTLAAALHDNAGSVKAWAMAPLMLAAPSALRALLCARVAR